MTPPTDIRRTIQVYVCAGCGAPMSHAQRCAPGCDSIEAHTIEVVPIAELKRLRRHADDLAEVARAAVGFIERPGLYRVFAWRRRAREVLAAYVAATGKEQ